ncbi:MAG TPA: dienelactone hydrolase family protein [Xanthobacteraceae bacterium]|nr:dienelactone hydrolase family protein [Xanthobacteraceae bacterium]
MNAGRKVYHLHVLEMLKQAGISRMRPLITVVFIAIIAAFSTAFSGGRPALAAPDEIEIPAGDIKLRAFIYRPEGKGPFPAVVALHDCNGLSGRSGPIAVRYRDWGERLSAAGLVVLFPDSFGSRGVQSQCSASTRTVRTWRERVSDTNAARQWLQDQSWIAADRVSALGWANGGIVALWAIRRQAAPPDKSPDFRSAVAFYPGCRRLAETAWSGRAPALILSGSVDDWSPASVCEQVIAGARGRSARASIIIYPGAHHDFDHPNRPLRQQSGLGFTVDASGRAHSGTDPAARADAIKRVPEWLLR